jgi:hypothetical protein
MIVLDFLTDNKRATQHILHLSSGPYQIVSDNIYPLQKYRV